MSTTISTNKLTGAGIKGDPVDLATAFKTVGVYRLRPPFSVTSAIMVTMKDGRNLYVNDNYVAPFPLDAYLNPQEKMVWPADVEVPDEIIP